LALGIIVVRKMTENLETRAEIEAKKAEDMPAFSGINSCTLKDS
jgi:hypothetical protein